MTETSSTPLTDKALARLRKLAADNGMAPEQIQLFGTEELTHTLQGTLTLTPKCDVETGRHPGPPHGGKNRKVFPDIQTLHEEVERRKKEFQSGRGWIDLSLKELKAAPGEGWGLQGAQITPPEKPIVLTASTTCPTCRGQRLVTCQTCRGQGTLVCQTCHGSRQEICFACGGTGNNPQNPNQRCNVCGGRRFNTCRRCGGSGQMTCPTCNGRRGTPCPGCNGTGLVSEELAVVCSVETHFKVKGESMPSGLRKSLDRLGMENMGKGHADIKMLPEAKDQDESDTTGDPERPVVTHIISYEAKLPYADMRMNFDGKKVVVGSFGKRGVLIDVPTFLDDALKNAREQLKQAALGNGSLHEALNTSVVKGALQLELGGKGTVQELRRMFPVGLSQEVMSEILNNVRLTLKQQTLKTRSITAALWSVISAGFFSGIFVTDLHASLTQNLSFAMQMIFDLVLLLIPMGLGWLALNFATKLSLQRRFQNHAISLQQTIGKTGYGMFAAILAIFALILTIAPVKPGWLIVIGF